jgi:hypothetical protein
MATNPGLARAFLGELWPESEPGYFAELGRMITAYAEAEAGVHFLARHFSGLPDAKARAIFGGMRLSDLTERIRQMMRIDETTGNIYREVDDCLVQLVVIADQRHKLVHRMVDYTGTSLSVSNPLTTKSLAAVERDVFSHSDLGKYETRLPVNLSSFLEVDISRWGGPRPPGGSCHPQSVAI